MKHTKLQNQVARKLCVVSGLAPRVARKRKTASNPAAERESIKVRLRAAAVTVMPVTNHTLCVLPYGPRRAPWA